MVHQKHPKDLKNTPCAPAPSQTNEQSPMLKILKYPAGRRWFSTAGNSLPSASPRTGVNVWTHFWLSLLGVCRVTGIRWVAARDGAQHPTIRRRHSTKKMMLCKRSRFSGWGGGWGRLRSHGAPKTPFSNSFLHISTSPPVK